MAGAHGPCRGRGTVPGVVDVWYVSYGSNLAAARFACYLSGGTPAGARRAMTGCRDARPARRWQPLVLPWRLRFGGDSPVWGGGVAYVDLDTPGTTYARAWRISVEQFADLVAQENGLGPGAVDVDAAVLAAGGLLLPGRSYGRLVALSPIEGVPAVTFTCVDPPAHQHPSTAYRSMVRAGLLELSLGDVDVDAYLDAAAA